MARNHHKTRYRVFVYGALVFESSDYCTAREYARLSKTSPDDRLVKLVEAHSDRPFFR